MFILPLFPIPHLHCHPLSIDCHSNELVDRLHFHVPLQNVYGCFECIHLKFMQIVIGPLPQSSHVFHSTRRDGFYLHPCWSVCISTLLLCMSSTLQRRAPRIAQIPHHHKKHWDEEPHTYHLMDLERIEGGNILPGLLVVESRGGWYRNTEIFLYLLVSSPAPKLPEYPSHCPSPFSRSPQNFHHPPTKG